MKDWQYEPACNMEKPIERQWKEFPRDPGFFTFLLRTFCHIGLRCFLKIYNRFEIRGKKNLPLGRSFILVANHSSHLDALCLLSALPFSHLHRAFPAAAADYFFASLPTSAFAAIFINALPFDRKLDGAGSLEVCRHLLENPGNILILFPEGTRSPTGEIGRFRSGIGRLVAGTSIPVVPCRLEGCQRAWGKGKAVPRPQKIQLIIGQPQNFDGSTTARESVAAICTQLRASLDDLSAANAP